MPAKLTRLELVIIISALVVLLLSNQPPERGNADIRKDIGQATDTPETPLQVQPDPTQSGLIRADDFAAQAPVSPMPDNLTVESIPQPQPQPKRFGMVDARACESLKLKYPHIMYGQITVRWIWNGTKLEPHKVCEVKEDNGIVTVWSFDDRHEGVYISEVPADQVPAY
ncbi:MAG: hypothetical protein ABFD90_07855 [Phycisphaerales bacterium]